MKRFSGRVLFLDRSDINTDEIIPAKYLTEVSRDALQPYLLEDLNLEEFDPSTDLDNKNVVVTRSNFGCGSSREHAPWAFEVNGFHLIIAESFARIFRQNMFNCGMLAVTLPSETIDRLFREFSGKDTTIETDLESKRFLVSSPDQHMEVDFDISDFDEALVKSGGWLEYADANY